MFNNNKPYSFEMQGELPSNTKLELSNLMNIGFMKWHFSMNRSSAEYSKPFSDDPDIFDVNNSMWRTVMCSVCLLVDPEWLWFNIFLHHFRNKNWSDTEAAVCLDLDQTTWAAARTDCKS